MAKLRAKVSCFSMCNILCCCVFFFTGSVLPARGIQDENLKSKQIIFKKILKITDADESFYFKYPTDIYADHGENIYVLDNNNILKFSKEGNFVSNLVAKGQGPGEISNISNLYLTADSIIIHDNYPPKIIWLDKSGKLLKELRLENSRWMQFIHFFDNEYFFIYSQMPVNNLSERIDHQVKIRGFRVELGEIESKLLAHDKIKEAVVIDREEGSGGRYLCAYIVCHPPSPGSAGSLAPFPVSGLRRFLSVDLPEYMIPSYFVQLEQIPLTPNGKVDRSALPEPEVKTTEDYRAPGDEVEEKLAGIWSEVLGIEKGRIGIDARFFELGGHSLKATILATKIHKTFNVLVPLVEIFKKPFIRAQAEFIRGAVENRYASIMLAEEREYFPVSPAQQRLYIVNQTAEESIAYNMSTFVVLKDDIVPGKLENIFRDLIARHESLRTSFEMVNGKPVQKIRNNGNSNFNFNVRCFEAGGMDDHFMPTMKRLVKNFVHPFDLRTPPLLRVGLIKVDRGRPLLMVDMHHIISDGASSGVLVKEFMALDSGEQLPPLRIQYKDYVQWHNSEKQREEVKKQEGFWLKEFSGGIPVMNLPCDYPRPAVKSVEGGICEFTILEEETGKLRALCGRENVTLFIVLLSIYNVLLAKITGLENIVIGTPLLGRPHADFHHIIGMFVNMLVLRNRPTGEKTFSKFLKEVKEKTLDTFSNQDYPFDDLVEKLKIKRDPGRNPLFDVVFTFQGQDEPMVEIPAEHAFDPGAYRFDFKTVQFDVILLKDITLTPGLLTAKSTALQLDFSL